MGISSVINNIVKLIIIMRNELLHYQRQQKSVEQLYFNQKVGWHFPNQWFGGLVVWWLFSNYDSR